MNQYIKFIVRVLLTCFFMGLFFCYLFRPTYPICSWMESVRARLVMGHVDYDGLFSTVRST